MKVSIRKYDLRFADQRNFEPGNSYLAKISQTTITYGEREKCMEWFSGVVKSVWMRHPFKLFKNIILKNQNQKTKQATATNQWLQKYTSS